MEEEGRKILSFLKAAKLERRRIRASPTRLSKIATQNILKYCIIYFN